MKLICSCLLISGASQVVKQFFVSIASLCLARTSNESKWHEIGKQSVKMMTKMANEYSDWNFRNKQHLLQALLYYHDCEIVLAETSFKASIVSAHEHGFLHEEALACELYGIFLIDTKNIVVGIEQLNLAIHKYMLWGAHNKVNDVKDLIDNTLCQHPTQMRTEVV